MPSQETSKVTVEAQYVDTYGTDGKRLFRDTFSKNGKVVNLSRVSNSTPKFRQRQKQGTLPSNPFTFDKNEIEYGHGAWITRYPKSNGGLIYKSSVGNVNGLYGIGSNTGQVAIVTTALAASMDAAARNKLRLKLKDQKVNLAQAFAERAMTADLIATTASRIAKAYSNLRKGNFPGAAEALGVHAASRATRRYRKNFERSQSKAAAGGWLELQYGWMPLLNDVYGSAEFLANKQYPAIRGRVVAVEQVDLPLDTNSDQEQFIVTNHATTKYVVRYVVYASTSSVALQTTAQAGITNPALLAWELLPYSFVADWFLPIGNWISSWDATLGLDFEKGSKTIFEQRSAEVSIVGTKKPDVSGYTYDGTWSHSRSTRTLVTRTVLSSFPMPGLPSFKNPVSLTHAANAIALVRQVFRR